MWMRACIRLLGLALPVVAVVAHVLGIMLSVCVWAVEDLPSLPLRLLSDWGECLLYFTRLKRCLFIFGDGQGLLWLSSSLLRLGKCLRLCLR